MTLYLHMSALLSTALESEQKLMGYYGWK